MIKLDIQVRLPRKKEKLQDFVPDLDQQLNSFEWQLSVAFLCIRTSGENKRTIGRPKVNWIY